MSGIRTRQRLICWQPVEGGWIGRGPSGASWSVTRDHDRWRLAGDRGRIAEEGRTPELLLEHAECAEAAWLASRNASLSGLPLAALLDAQRFATAKLDALIDDMRRAGFDPTGMEGPCTAWMRREIIASQRAIDRLEREAVDRGWHPDRQIENERQR